MLVWCIRGLVLCLCRSEKDKEELLLSPSPLITLSLSELVHTISNIYTHQFNFLLHASVRVSIWPQVFYDLTLQIFYILPDSFPPEACHHEGQTSLIPWFKVDEITSDQENTDFTSADPSVCYRPTAYLNSSTSSYTALSGLSRRVCVKSNSCLRVESAGFIEISQSLRLSNVYTILWRNIQSLEAG